MYAGLPRDTAEKILHAAVQAPSGSNSQPWRFEVSEMHLSVVALPERDHPLLNVAHRGTWLAHGALIENIAVAAGHFGYRAEISIPENFSTSRRTAVIRFEKSAGKSEEDLYDAIFFRATNRKPYHNTELAPIDREALLEAGNAYSGVRCAFVEDRARRKVLGEAGSINEIVMLEHKPLHALFFKEIVWSEREEKERGGGLFAPTMELAPPERFMLKNAFRHWGMMKIASALGMARMIAKKNAATYATGSAMGALLVPDSDRAFLHAGRALERIWLSATHRGMSMHLITGTLFFAQRVMRGDTMGLKEKHVELIKNGYAAIASAFGAGNDMIAVMFRLGVSDPPSARSWKPEPLVAWNAK